MAVPNQLAKRKFAALAPDEQQHYDQVIDTINSLVGHNGTIQLANHLDLRNNRVMNVGQPVDAADALPSGTAQKTYAASVLRPQLESSGSSPMQTMRRLNDRTQREQTSTWLNDLMSSVPSANGIFPTISPSGGGVSVSIPSSLFTFSDGTSTKLQARTDLLSLPAQYAINTISSVGTVVSLTTLAASGLVAGQIATVLGVTPSSFNGTVQLTGATPPYGLQYQSNLGTVSGSGGYVQVNGVYYYGVNKRSQQLVLLGPFSADTAQNRLNANFDGTQIVAVVVLTASGGQVAQSGGGGSPIVGSPSAGSFF